MKVTKLYILSKQGIKHYTRFTIDIPQTIIFYIAIKFIESTVESVININISDMTNNTFLL